MLGLAVQIVSTMPDMIEVGVLSPYRTFIPRR
jgi:hypothetical protein